MSEKHVWVRRERLYPQAGGYSEGCFCGEHAIVALNKLITESDLAYVQLYPLEKIPKEGAREKYLTVYDRPVCMEHGCGFEPLVEIQVMYLDRSLRRSGQEA